MDMKFAIYWTGLFFACVFTVFAFLTNIRMWKMWDRIQFRFTFGSWPTKDNRLKELQKDQFILEKLCSYALALHKANERQARVLDTIKRGGLKYKEAINQLAHAKRVQKHRYGRFDRARAIAKHCGFDVPPHLADYLTERMQEAILRGRGNITA